MKDWLADKKNQPIVIGIASVIIVAVVVFLLFQLGVLGQSAAAPMVASGDAGAAPGAPGMGGPPMPGGPALGGTSGATAATASGGVAPKPAPGKTVQIAKAIGRKDPFMPAVVAKNLVPPRPDINIGHNVYSGLPPLPGPNSTPSAPLPPAPGPPVQLGTISGIMIGAGIGVGAIYEANGRASVIHPGDELPDGNGTVQSIDSSGVTINTTSNNRVTLPVTAGTVDSGSQNQNGGPSGVPPGV